MNSCNSIGPVFIAVLVAVITVIGTAAVNHFQAKHSLLKEKLAEVVKLMSEVSCSFQNDRNVMFKLAVKTLRSVMNEHSDSIDAINSQTVEPALKEQYLKAFLTEKIASEEAISIEYLEEGFDLESIILIELKTDQLKLIIANYFPEMESQCKVFLNEAQNVFNVARKPITIDEILNASSVDLTKLRKIKNDWLSYLIENRADLVSPFKVESLLSSAS
jgi:hypothetical protein